MRIVIPEEKNYVKRLRENSVRGELEFENLCKIYEEIYDHKYWAYWNYPSFRSFCMATNKDYGLYSFGMVRLYLRCAKLLPAYYFRIYSRGQCLAIAHGATEDIRDAISQATDQLRVKDLTRLALNLNKEYKNGNKKSELPLRIPSQGEFKVNLLTKKPRSYQGYLSLNNQNYIDITFNPRAKKAFYIIRSCNID